MACADNSRNTWIRILLAWTADPDGNTIGLWISAARFIPVCRLPPLEIYYDCFENACISTLLLRGFGGAGSTG
jgi:hypothetical protein